MTWTGKHLIQMGYTPAKWFGEVLETANRLGYNELDVVIMADQKVAATPTYLPLKDETEYHYSVNMKRLSYEDANADAVADTMMAVLRTPTVVDEGLGGAIMPDACPAGPVGTIPVGGVVKTKNAIHPGMHSADICCSVMVSDLGNADPKAVMDAAYENCHFGPGGRYDFDRKVPLELMEKLRLNSFTSGVKALNMAESHLGTSGDGNHFIYVGTHEYTGNTMLVTHFGSRGFGAQVYKAGMRVAEKYRRALSPETLKQNAWIPADTKEGKEYWEALKLVREWTKTNHLSLHSVIAGVVGKYVHYGETTFWNPHNFVFQEGDTFYHAKGATPLDDKFMADSVDGLRIIPLNMAEPILIVKGEATYGNLGFAPHGAGRNMSRAAYKRSLGDRDLNDVLKEQTEGLDIRFFSGVPDVSELPGAYKCADTIQAEIEEYGLGEVQYKILPYGSIMAGDYKKPWE